MIDLDELERLAKAATPGPWTRQRDWAQAVDSHGAVWPTPENGRYILAANPAVVLELITRLRAADSADSDREKSIAECCAEVQQALKDDLLEAEATVLRQQARIEELELLVNASPGGHK